MFEQIIDLFRLLFGLYDRLTPEQKEALKKTIVDSFEAILRAFFRSQSQEQAA